LRKIPITTAGAEKLREELRRLKAEDRPRIARAIAEARAHGDLRENAEYHAAKDEQGLAEARIRDLEERLAKAEVIDVTRLDNRGRVVFGATVELFEESESRTVRYQIVGEYEAQIEAGLVSVTSPIARALIGREEGDVARVETPAGERIYEIVKVEYI